MSSSTSRALQLPEILHQIAQWIPLFQHGPVSELAQMRYYPMYDHFEPKFTYKPCHLASCTLVSRLWNTCFTPYLYHYYVEEQEGKDRQCLSFRQHSHLIRRFLPSSDQAKFAKQLPYEEDKPPENLVGLFMYTMRSPLDKLLVLNQGSSLRQLVWTGNSRIAEDAVAHREALMSLTGLEELELRRLTITNGVLYRILCSCAESLRTLRLENVNGFDERAFESGDEDLDISLGHNGDDEEFTNLLADVTTNSMTVAINGSSSNSDSRLAEPLTLPRLKSLRLLLARGQPKSSVLLVRRCPSLESIHITVDREELPVSLLVEALRENCPHLASIGYYAMRLDDGYYPEAPLYASLVKDSFRSAHLRNISLGLPYGLDDHTMEALLFHAGTLTELELRCCANSRLPERRRTPAVMDMKKMVVLLAQCVRLQMVRLIRVRCGIQDLHQLFSAPWGCRGLKTLLIDGYTPTPYLSTNSQMDATVYHSKRQELRTRSKRIRQEAWPRKLRHHEYRDDGQGWFLKPGLTGNDFFDALVDGDWKRQLFRHLYTTSHVDSIKFVRLNHTEFYSKEQPFLNPEAERKEMELEEDMVVDYREVIPWQEESSEEVANM
ncbi:hypothetical protein BGX31_007641 [Mortierella sp. GBA43]|nr:hypothetical protein BGX31_007641 [Mortierella sp. GBA43]